MQLFTTLLHYYNIALLPREWFTPTDHRSIQLRLCTPSRILTTTTFVQLIAGASQTQRQITS